MKTIKKYKAKPKSHHKGDPNMDNVKIKRRKHKKQKIGTKEKVLAGIGVGSTLLGGVGAVAPKPPTTQFVRSQETQKQGSTSAKIKGTLKNIFGVKQAKASGFSAEEQAVRDAEKALSDYDTWYQNAQADINAGYFGENTDARQNAINEDRARIRPALERALEQARQNLADAQQAQQQANQNNQENNQQDQDDDNNTTRRTYSPRGRGGSGSNNDTDSNADTDAPGDSWELTSEGRRLGLTPKQDRARVILATGKMPDGSTATQEQLNQANEDYYSTLTSPNLNLEDLIDAQPLSIPISYYENGRVENLNDGTSQSLNPNQLAKLETAQAIAALVGGEVVDTAFRGFPFNMTVPRYDIKFPNGRILSGGLLARKLESLQRAYERNVENYNLNIRNNPNLTPTVPADPIELFKDYVEGQLSSGSASGSGSSASGNQSTGEQGGQGGGLQPGGTNYNPGISPGSYFPQASPTANPGTGNSSLSIGNPLGTNSANASVYITHATAFDDEGRNVGTIIRPGNTIEIGGVGLDAYTSVHLAVGEQDFQMEHVTFSGNKIRIEVPVLGSVPSNAQVQVRLLSSNGSIQQGVVPQYFLYQQQASAGQQFQRQTITYGQGVSNYSETANHLSQRVSNMENRLDNLANQFQGNNSALSEIDALRTELASLSQEIESLRNLLQNQ